MLRFVLAFFELLNQLCQRCQLLCIHQIELINEVYKVLETSVQVGLCTQEHDVLKVGVVNVRIHSEQSFEYHLYNVEEVLWERDT